jgi:uncharacterized membrane protein YedE/YeeE
MSGLALAIAFLCVVLMGYAVQRGATCTVAAVEEWVTRRSVRRLLSMFEASLWVAGGLVVAQALQLLPAMPAGFALTGITIVGGVLLGLGAWINGACVFGAIARLGSGEWAYAMTPAGYFVGCLTVDALFAPTAPQRLSTASPIFAAPELLAVAFVLFALWRVGPALWRADLATLRAKVWQPHAATTVIGITFFFTLLLAGAWAYTDLLADLARGRFTGIAPRLALFVALLAGAAWGGYSAGRWKPGHQPSAVMLARCFAGGALMGYGTLLIPGSNDGLILVGLPLLRPYAWVAFATMCLTIAAAQVLRRRVAGAAAAAATEPGSGQTKSSQIHHGAPREDGAT